MRRLLTVLLGSLVVLAGLLGLAAPAGAQNAAPDEATESDAAAVSVAPVDVLQVAGLFDEVLVAEIEAAIERAEANGRQALLLQVNSRGAVVSDERMAELFTAVDDAEVPIAVWVGPTGARLYGAPAQLIAVADVSGMAAGARIGNVGRPIGEIELSDGLAALESSTAGLSEARDLRVFRQRIFDEGIPVITNMLYALDGFEENGVAINTAITRVTESGTVQNELIAVPVNAKLGLVDQLFHTVASPPVAYLLLLIGLGLLVFEFFTAGVGIAGVVGAVCTILACYGLAELPTRWWAAWLLGGAMIAFAIDVQVGLPRLWTGVGIVFVVIGSFGLYEPITGTSMRLPWITLIAGIGGTMLAFVVGMPSMTRTRFATPTIGREWMVGAEGVAVGAIDPDGIVRVGDGEWMARTHRATPIAAGDALRVAAIDGVTLEVEPLEGAAKDYREMRNRS